MKKTKELTELAFYQELEYANDYSKREAKLQGIQLAKFIVDKGNEEVIKSTSKLARFAEVINNAFAELKNHLIVDKETVHNGVKFNQVNGRTIYSFSHDFVWQDYQNKIDELKAMQKLREKQMLEAFEMSQKIPKQELQVDGEIIEPAKVDKHTKGYIKITF